MPIALVLWFAACSNSAGGDDTPLLPSSAKEITVLSIEEAPGGTVNYYMTSRTVTVTVPLTTNLTSLTPVIIHSGVTISTDKNDPQNFFDGGFTPVEYTVTAEDGSKAVWTVMVRLEPLAPGTDIGDYLSDSSADPVILPLSIDLSGTGWPELLTAIAGQSKNVALDLSVCTGMTEFDPGTTNTGKGKIVSLVLPDEAETVTAGTNPAPTFRFFTSLRKVSATNVTSIGNFAFSDCTALKAVSLPAATSIGTYAFESCISLETVSLPAATSIGTHAFYNCALKAVSLPAATSIGTYTFRACTILEELSLPTATIIENFAFYGCTSLATVSLPAATSIGTYAFGYTGSTALTVTLGATVPTLGDGMFAGVTVAKTVTVRVPSGATGYGVSPTDTTVNWGNGFRGMGWDGSSYLTPYINSDISLTIEQE